MPGAGGPEIPGSSPHLTRPPQETWHLSPRQLRRLAPGPHPGETAEHAAAGGAGCVTHACLLITPLSSALRLAQPASPWRKACPSDASPARSPGHSHLPLRLPLLHAAPTPLSPACRLLLQLPPGTAR